MCQCYNAHGLHVVEEQGRIYQNAHVIVRLMLKSNLNVMYRCGNLFILKYFTFS